MKQLFVLSLILVSFLVTEPFSASLGSKKGSSSFRRRHKDYPLAKSITKDEPYAFNRGKGNERFPKLNDLKRSDSYKENLNYRSHNGRKKRSYLQDDDDTKKSRTSYGLDNGRKSLNHSMVDDTKKRRSNNSLHNRRKSLNHPLVNDTKKKRANYSQFNGRKSLSHILVDDTMKRGTNHSLLKGKKRISQPLEDDIKNDINVTDLKFYPLYDATRRVIPPHNNANKSNKENSNGTYQNRHLGRMDNDRKNIISSPAGGKNTHINQANSMVTAATLTESTSRQDSGGPVGAGKALPHLGNQTSVQVMPTKLHEISLPQQPNLTSSLVSLSRTMELLPQDDILIKCPKSKPIFDSTSNTCRKPSFPLRQMTLFVPVIVKVVITIPPPKKNVTTNKTNTTSKNLTKNGSPTVVIYKTITVRNCSAVQKYEPHEYTMLQNNGSVVYIKMTGEVLQSKDYYKSAKESQAIVVCRPRHEISNCSGVYIVVNEGEFRVLANKSIFVNASKQLYNLSEYTWQNKSVVVCENFSKYYYKTRNTPNEEVLEILTLVCMSLSIAGLVFVLVTYSLFSELRTPPGINLMNLSVSILLTQLLWLLGSGQTDTPMACTAIAVILHYLFLVSFMWTSIIAFDTWRAFSAKGRRQLADSRHQRMRKCLRYMAVGWLPVMMYVGMCVAFDELDVVTIQYGSIHGCWITNNYAKVYLFGIPVLVIVIFNLVFYSMTVRSVQHTRHQTRLLDAAHLQRKRDFCMYVRVGALMGFTWIFGFAAPFVGQFLWYPFVILNSLQGVYIALAFALSSRARKLYEELCRRKKKEPNRKSSNNQDRSTKQSFVIKESKEIKPVYV